MAETLSQMLNMVAQWSVWIIGSLFCLFFFEAISLNILEWALEGFAPAESDEQR